MGSYIYWGETNELTHILIHPDRGSTFASDKEANTYKS